MIKSRFHLVLVLLCDEYYISQYIFKNGYVKKVHDSFNRNYKKTQWKNKPYTGLQIAQVYYLESGECISVLKTFWLRIFVRVCRKFIEVKKKMCDIRYILRRCIF